MRLDRLERLLIVGLLIASLGVPILSAPPCSPSPYMSFRSTEQPRQCCCCGCGQGPGCNMTCCRPSSPPVDREVPPTDEHRYTRDESLSLALSPIFMLPGGGVGRHPAFLTALTASLSSLPLTLQAQHVCLQV